MEQAAKLEDGHRVESLFDLGAKSPVTQATEQGDFALSYGSVDILKNCDENESNKPFGNEYACLRVPNSISSDEQKTGNLHSPHTEHGLASPEHESASMETSCNQGNRDDTVDYSLWLHPQFVNGKSIYEPAPQDPEQGTTLEGTMPEYGDSTVDPFGPEVRPDEPYQAGQGFDSSERSSVSTMMPYHQDTATEIFNPFDFDYQQSSDSEGLGQMRLDAEHAGGIQRVFKDRSTQTTTESDEDSTKFQAHFPGLVEQRRLPLTIAYSGMGAFAKNIMTTRLSTLNALVGDKIIFDGKFVELQDVWVNNVGREVELGLRADEDQYVEMITFQKIVGKNTGYRFASDHCSRALATMLRGSLEDTPPLVLSPAPVQDTATFDPLPGR